MTIASAPQDEGADGEVLVDRIAALIDLARERVAAVMAEEGLPYTQLEVRPILEPTGNGWAENRTEVEVNSLTLVGRPGFRSEMLTEWFAEAEVIGSELVSLFPDARSLAGHFPSGRLGFASLYPRGPEIEDVKRSTPAAGLIEPTESYILRLPSAAQPDIKLARSISTEILALLSTGKCIARQSIAIAGVEPEHDLLECTGTRLRELSALERRAISSIRQRLGSTSRLGPYSHFILATHLLEMDTEMEQANMASLLPVPRILLAFQLHGFDPSGPGSMTTKILPEWWFNGLSSRRIDIKEISAKQCSLSQGEFEDVCRTADLLTQFQLDSPDSPRDVALQRFALGCTRLDPVERLVDFVIALEALLLPDDPETGHGNLSYRFRVHGALFLADSAGENRIIFKSLRDLYAMRSRIVHGDKYPDTKEATNAADESRRLAARGLLKAVYSGFPTAENLTRLVLREDVAVPADEEGLD